jgi:hypothetical protein
VCWQSNPRHRLKSGAFHRISALIACLLFAGIACAAPPAIDLSAADGQIIEDAHYLWLAESLSLDEVRKREFQPFSREQVNQGVSRDRHWLHFVVHNPTDQPREWILRGETTYLDNLVVFHRDDPQRDFTETQLSDREPFGELLKGASRKGDLAVRFGARNSLCWCAPTAARPPCESPSAFALTLLLSQQPAATS